MVIAFQIIVLIIILISFIGVVGERKDKNLRNNLTAVSIAAIFGFIASVVLL